MYGLSGVMAGLDPRLGALLGLDAIARRYGLAPHEALSLPAWTLAVARAASLVEEYAAMRASR